MQFNFISFVSPMTPEQLNIILQEGEGYNVEFKQAIPSKLRELAEEICAFANAAGGVLLIGIKDNNTICGVEIDNSTRSRIREAIKTIDPPLDVQIDEIPIDGKKIICLDVKTGSRKPYAASGNIFVRNGPNCEKITSIEKMREFFQLSGRIFFDEAPANKFKYTEDFDSEFFARFLKKAGITASNPEKIMLENLQLSTEDGKFKNGAVLMFAKDPQKFIDTALIRCVLFKGTTKRFILDVKEMTGNLVHQYEEALKYIVSKLNLRYEIESQRGGPRLEVLEIPEPVFREALINALSHRDYYERGANIMVEIYDNRVEITNPGGLIGTISINEFGTRSFSRNPLVFGLFNRMDLVEKIGSGINRMKEAMRAANLPEPVFSLEGIFAITLFRPVDFESWLLKTSAQINDTQKNILREVYRKNSITAKTLAKILHISQTAIENNISALKDLGVLERRGSKKLGSYYIIFKTWE
jgi:ATP-dependent DNA helicase RecG